MLKPGQGKNALSHACFLIQAAVIDILSTVNHGLVSRLLLSEFYLLQIAGHHSGVKSELQLLEFYLL